MKLTKKKAGIFALKIFAVLFFIVAVFASGFLFLDKIIIPKYFGEYDINGLGDLIGVVSSLYSSPDEKSLVKNGYSDADLTSGVEKLQGAGYKIEDDGTILPENMSTFKGTGKVTLTDREFSAICNRLLQTQILEDSLPNLNYINIMNITIVDLVITPDDESYNEETGTFSKANILFIIKVGTDDLRTQIALQMQTPEALIKMIIPSELYFTVNYDIDLNAEEENRTTGTIAINGKTEKQSEILINLLIEFIFPSESEMNIEKFTKEIGNVALSGIDTLGNFSFLKDVEGSGLNGMLIE